MATMVDGVTMEPLYLERPEMPSSGAVGYVRVCVRADAGAIADEVDGGADALWVADDVPVPTGVLRVTDTHVGELPVVSSLEWHARGANVPDEVALLLSRGADSLERGTAVALRVAVGRDTFTELCKLRALRLCWRKLLRAANVSTPPMIHAVCSSRTMTEHDPWVNMLRTTTQLFAAMLGGADLVTPLPYDSLLDGSPQGRRIARNAALVLREESGLGRVIDPAYGSYALDSLTEQIAREAWKRFQVGVDGSAIDAAYDERQKAIRKRKEPVLGVSEFANLDERVVVTEPHHDRRDAAPFEALRDAPTHPDVTLVTLGPPAEHRARLGFAQGFFPAGGLRTKVGADGSIVCICGNDERYAAEAADAARRMKSAGARRVLLAGKPGALEGALRDAGVDDFIFVGCDVVAVLWSLVTP